MSRRKTFLELQARAVQLLRMNEQILQNNKLPHEDNTTMDVAAIMRAEEEDDILRVEFVDTLNSSHIYEIGDIEEDVRDLYIRWFHFRALLTSDCDSLKSECDVLFHTRRNVINSIISAKFNEDFVEKQNVQWWSIEDLVGVLKNGGYTNSEFFRAYFLPVLQRSIEEVMCQSCSPCQPDTLHEDSLMSN